MDRWYGSTKFGTKTEMKNLNSFEHVKKGLEYEAKRQERVLLAGGEIQQETPHLLRRASLRSRSSF